MQQYQQSIAEADMKVKIDKASKMFFGNQTALETVYFGAISNALDADANRININITYKNNDTKTLLISIEDNGIGFTDERFEKFNTLFYINDINHKGIGRLVYLHYFNNINIISHYENNKTRQFDFSASFDGNKCDSEHNDKIENGTILSMSSYSLSKIHSLDYINSNYLKNAILKKFYARLYNFKESNRDIEISIKTNIDDREEQEILSTIDFPVFEVIEIPSPNNMFSACIFRHNIEECVEGDENIITAIAVDDRTHHFEIIAKENWPPKYKMVFLLFSDTFNGKWDAIREKLLFSTKEQNKIKDILKENVIKIINEKIPEIIKQNKEKQENFINRYPHLNNYFKVEDIGYVSTEEILKTAQNIFFNKQKEILEATHLNQEQYEKSLEMASRSLAQYILFRQNTINRLKEISSKDNEKIIHNLIVPQRKKFKGKNLTNDLYRNNIWVLDDKYMTYDTILSDIQMSEIINIITEGEVVEKDDGRPDIAIIFSNDPTDNSIEKKADVVIIELKRKGVAIKEKVNLEQQLKDRARKLLKRFDNKIQQIWFYGVADIDKEYEHYMKDEKYHRLYSNGKLYYKPEQVSLTLESAENIPIGIFIMDLDALIKDADARNFTFLNILKNDLSNYQMK